MSLNYDIFYCLTVPLYVIAVYYLFSIFLGAEKNRKIEIFSYLVFGALLIGWYFVSTIPVFNFLITIVSYSVLSLNYKAELLKKVLSIFYILFITLALETTLTLIFLDIDTNLFIDSEAHSPSIIIVIRTVMLLASYLLNRLIYNVKKDYKVPINNYIFYVFILSGVLYLYLTSINNSTLSALNVTVNSIVLILVVILLILNDEKIYKSILIYAERNILREQNLSYENQNKMLTQSDANIKMLKHDMKNHLNMLNEMFKNNKRHEIEKYMEEIVDEIGKRNISESGNFAIDSILNFKLSQFEDIKLFLDVKIPQTIGISATDITIILGNLLDNAIKATLKTDEKLLKIKISCKLENLVILIDNSYNKEYQDTNLTNIENNSEHGLGLISVKNALEKYGGEIQIKQTDSLFMVSAIIPFNRQ